MSTLEGRRVAILATDGVEQAELEQPWQALLDEGAAVDLVSISDGSVQTIEQDIHPAKSFDVDRVVGDVQVGDYDPLVLPGGASNPDKLRGEAAAVAFVREFTHSGKPVAAIAAASSR